MKNKTYKLAVIASIGGFLFGFDTAVISGTTEMVRQQYGLTDLLEGWYVSSGLVGCIVGVLAAGFLGDFFGRKRSLLFSAILFSISALGCAATTTFDGLVFYRILGGVGVGIASMLSPIYISEIAPQNSRGKLTSLYQLAITLGILSAFITNAVVRSQADVMAQWLPTTVTLSTEAWRGMFAVELIPALAFFILLFTIPQSPRWLWSHGRKEQANKIIQEYRIDDFAQIAIKMSDKKVNYLRVPKLRLAIFAGTVLAVLTQTSGINAIMYYGNSILSKGGADIQGAFEGQILIGVINVIFTFIAIFSIDQIGRKKLLYLGVTCIITSLSLTGLMFYVGAAPHWKLLFIMAFVASYAFSYGPVIWVLLSELFPTEIRGRAMSIAVLALWVANTLVGQFVPWLRTHISESGIFWLFALCCVPTYFIVKKYLPETKGKSLEEIEAHWLQK